VPPGRSHTGVIAALCAGVLAIAPGCLPAPPRAGVDWTTYHLDNTRSAHVETGAKLPVASLAWRREDLDGPVYAEPLVFRDSVYVVTENDTLYALAASTGRVEWRLRLGRPAVNPIFHCTPIVPLGITSTPVVDVETARLYTAGVVDTGDGDPRYQTWLFSIDLQTRSVAFHVRVDTPEMNPDTYNQRGALTLTGSRVYIPFGGRPGDCGTYHGVITSVKAADGGQLFSFRNTGGDVTGGGFWAAGGLAVAGNGDLLAASGNALSRGSFCGAGFHLQDSVTRLSPGLAARPIDRWTPPNWRELDCYDADIGAMVPTVLSGVHLVFQSGKGGVAYLLHENSLGGTSPAAFSANLRAGECRGGAAFDGRLVFVGCEKGMYGLRLDASRPSLGLPGHGGWGLETRGCDAEPPIVASGVVWWLDRCHTLHGADAGTGRPLFAYGVGSGNHFATPAQALGKLFVPVATGVAAFDVRA
jgi:hypothetical protein